MGARRWSGLMVAGMLLAACTGGSDSTSVGEASGSPEIQDLLVLDTVDGASVVNTATGEIMTTAPGAILLPDGSALFAASAQGDASILQSLDTATGESMSSAPIPGDLAVQAVSDDGALVALVQSPEPGTDTWTPVSRAKTRITVADPSGGSQPETYVLDGNFVPEAFSTNDKHLFMIQYLPALEPNRYKVASLELADGDVYDVIGRSKTPPEEMSGTRLEQVLAPSGEALYTLYTNQPPEYAEYAEYGQGSAWGGGESEPVAFVHVLQLRERWAYCAPLPKQFGPGPAEAKAIALSPDGSTIFVVDARGFLTRLDVKKLKHDGSHRVDLGLAPDGAASARFGPDGTLYVAGGSEIVAIDPDSLAVQRRWPVAAAVTGLGLSPGGSAVYATTTNELVWLDAQTGDLTGSVEVAGLEGIAYVGPVSA